MFDASQPIGSYEEFEKDFIKRYIESQGKEHEIRKVLLKQRQKQIAWSTATLLLIFLSASTISSYYLKRGVETWYLQDLCIIGLIFSGSIGNGIGQMVCMWYRLRKKYKKIDLMLGEIEEISRYGNNIDIS
jgi:hypothetical protein